MGSHQLITVPDYNWITITSNNPKGLFEVITVRDGTKWRTHGGLSHLLLLFQMAYFSFLAFEVSFAFLLASKSSIAVNIMAAVR